MVDDDRSGGAQGDATEGHAADVPGEVGNCDNQSDSSSVEVDRVGEINAVLDPDSNAEHADHAVEDGTSATEDTGGNRCDERTELRHEREQEGAAGGDQVGSRRVDAGCCHNADVFGVGRRTRTAARTCEHGGDTICEEGASGQIVKVLAGHCGNRLHVADVFGDQDEDHGDEEAQGGDGEGGSVELRKTEPSGLANTVEVHLVLDDSSNVTDEHAEEDREAADDSLEQNRDQADGEDCDDCGDGAGLHPVPCGGCKVQADEGNDCACNGRGHDRIDPANTCEVNDDADKSQGCTGGDDAAQCEARAKFLSSGDCQDRRN